MPSDPSKVRRTSRRSVPTPRAAGVTKTYAQRRGKGKEEHSTVIHGDDSSPSAASGNNGDEILIASSGGTDGTRASAPWTTVNNTRPHETSQVIPTTRSDGMYKTTNDVAQRPHPGSPDQLQDIIDMAASEDQMQDLEQDAEQEQGFQEDIPTIEAPMQGDTSAVPSQDGETDHRPFAIIEDSAGLEHSFQRAWKMLSEEWPVLEEHRARKSDLEAKQDEASTALERHLVEHQSIQLQLEKLKAASQASELRGAKLRQALASAEVAVRDADTETAVLCRRLFQIFGKEDLGSA